jgi:hypothetical protein
LRTVLLLSCPVRTPKQHQLPLELVCLGLQSRVLLVVPARCSRTLGWRRPSRHQSCFVDEGAVGRHDLEALSVRLECQPARFVEAIAHDSIRQSVLQSWLEALVGCDHVKQKLLRAA